MFVVLHERTTHVVGGGMVGVAGTGREGWGRETEGRGEGVGVTGESLQASRSDGRPELRQKTVL